MTDTSKEAIAKFRDGHRESAPVRFEVLLECLEALAIERDAATAKCDAVMRHIPMDYLQRHDVPGATGPTAALNLDKAMRDYSEDRWKLIEKIAKATERAEKAEAERDKLSGFYREIVEFLGDDCAIGTIKSLRARVAALEGAVQSLTSAIYNWSRPTGANGMVPICNDHPLLVAAAKADVVLVYGQAALSAPPAPAVSQAAADVLAAVPDDLKDAIRRMGAIEWGATAAKPAEEHAADMLSSVTKTAECFAQTGNQQMHGCYLQGSEVVICHTGTSPNSPNHARLIVGLWNWFLAEIERLNRAAQAEREG